MLTTTAGKPVRHTNTQQVTYKTDQTISGKIWLPKLLYTALPHFYLVAGFIAFFTTLYISEWFWVLPHYLLFSAACIHLGLRVLRRRRPSANSGS